MNRARRPKPSGQAGLQVSLYFTPLSTFEANGPYGVRSAYVEGMFYTVRDPELEAFAREWERRGLVRFVSTRPRATARGTLETS